VLSPLSGRHSDAGSVAQMQDGSAPCGLSEFAPCNPWLPGPALQGHASGHARWRGPASLQACSKVANWELLRVMDKIKIQRRRSSSAVLPLPRF